MRYKLLRDQLSLSRRSFALVWRTSPWLALVSILATGATAAILFYMAYVGKNIIDAAQARSVDDAVFWVIVEVGLVLLRSGAQRLLELSRSLLGNRLAVTVQEQILVKAASLELEQLEDSKVADLIAQANREATARPVSILYNSLEILKNVSTLIGYGAIVITYSPWMALGIAIASVPAAILEMRFSQKVFGLQNWRSPLKRQLSYFEFLLTRDANAKEMKVYALNDYFLGRYRRQQDEFLAVDTRLMKRRLGWAYGFSIVSDLAFYGCYGAMVLSAARGDISIGSLALYSLAFRQGQTSLETLFMSMRTLYENNLYISNLFRFLELPKLNESPAQRSQIGTSSSIPPTGIYFDHVDFKYPDNESFALKDVSFHIPKGQSVAIVGFNGSGKTTLIKLLCRLYRPTSGRIAVNGRNLDDWDREDLWKRIGVLFQDFVKYQLTVGENVGLGGLEQSQDKAQVERALDQGGARDMVQNLPLGASTQLGRWFNGGTELSGGQWQKIALARAFMREDAEFLILDEPSAALDAQAEYEIFERFRRLTEGKTSLIITHRFSTARLASRILLMERGELIEEGTHEELLARNGKYAGLYRLQAQTFTDSTSESDQKLSPNPGPSSRS